MLAVGGVPAAVAAPETGSYGAAIDAYARYEGQKDCIPIEQPGVQDFRALVMAAYPNTGRGNMVRECSGTGSEHSDGRAWDWMVNAGNSVEKAQADEMLAWLLATDEHGNKHAMARRLGIMYIIWDRQVWKAYRPEDGWTPYSGASPHTDHVHFSFGWAGATRQTTYWTQPPLRCDGRAYALTGDWDGSGRDGIGWWCDGKTKLRSAAGVDFGFAYGRSGDVPVAADWNGDGRDTLSVIRDGVWHLNNELLGGASQSSFVYGRVSRGDVPIAGSWNRGGRDLPGIVRDREWHLRDAQSSGSSTWNFVYGRLSDGDLPLWGDWNGSGGDNVGIVRQGEWHLRAKHAAGDSDIDYVYGRVLAGDIPVVGDWNGDGVDTPGIVRDGSWMLKDHHGAGDADATVVFKVLRR